jgi:squalene-hopene/tetraprenyl-beta-curcumene cyclase
MDLLKNFLVRLSDSFFSTVPVGLRYRTDKRKHHPSLKLVSLNPNPISSTESAQWRASHHAVGHAEAIDEAIARSERRILSRQDPQEGFWVEELEADATLTSEYLMLRHSLGVIDEERVQAAVAYLEHAQLEEGGWPIYLGGPSDISASVKAYFALKLSGISPDEPFVCRAREAILAQGGVVAANVFTKITLAMFGQYDWKGVPSMPPEVLLAPKKFYFNLYALSYWSRAVLVPLLIVFAHRPLYQISREQGIEELFVCPPDRIQYQNEPPFKKDPCWISWRNFFVWVDKVLKLYEKYPITSVRKIALQKAESWVLDRMKGEGGLGAIYPGLAYSIYALRSLGYPATHPMISKTLREIEDLEIWTNPKGGKSGEAMLHLQPCHSPIWDTALTLSALQEGGISPRHPALTQAYSWLMSRQTTSTGDWIVSSPEAQPGGWYFQFENELYPDVDDTAAVVTALSRFSWDAPGDDDERIRRGCNWALAMQSSDGGWGAYDKDNNRLIFNKIPFADHQALLDPSTADLTGRCLEMLGTLGYDQSHPAVPSALEFLKQEQEPDGSWYGRWGINYIYGTWCVLAGLRAIGVDMSEPWIQRAVVWLESTQNLDGGWGESCESYADPEMAGQGESTVSQTSWALFGLLAAGVSDSLNVVRGVNYLLRHQADDGSWEEPFHTGTGFPRVFYLRYHGYFQYFPYWALALYRNIRTNGDSRADELREKIKGLRQSQSSLPN